MRVGTRPVMSGIRLTRGDHPHACGDKVCENYYVGDGVGSSPCVWGQVQDFYNVVNNYRIIPMRVGTRF